MNWLRDAVYWLLALVIVLVLLPVLVVTAPIALAYGVFRASFEDEAQEPGEPL